MQDESVLQHITKLVDEERDLVASAAPVAEKEARLKQLGEELDRCRDLLRQRRAKREFGGTRTAHACAMPGRSRATKADAQGATS